MNMGTLNYQSSTVPGINSDFRTLKYNIFNIILTTACLSLQGFSDWPPNQPFQEILVTWRGSFGMSVLFSSPVTCNCDANLKNKKKSQFETVFFYFSN